MLRTGARWWQRLLWRIPAIRALIMWDDYARAQKRAEVYEATMFLTQQLDSRDRLVPAEFRGVA